MAAQVCRCVVPDSVFANTVSDAVDHTYAEMYRKRRGLSQTRTRTQWIDVAAV